MKQTSFFTSPPLFHGGDLQRGKRKSCRPLSSNRPLHCVLKAKSKNLYENKKEIEQQAFRLADKAHVKIYSIAVNFDHVHMVLNFPSRRNYAAFLRGFTGLLARKLGAGLWKMLPFTRVLAWGKDFRHVLSYLQKNREEAAGARPYEPRRDWYATRKNRK